MSKGNSEECNDLSWYNLTPSWTNHTTKLNEDFGIKYQGDGWYQFYGDWTLINKTLTGFYVMVWYGYDPRPFLKKVADAEVRT